MAGEVAWTCNSSWSVSTNGGASEYANSMPEDHLSEVRQGGGASVNGSSSRCSSLDRSALPHATGSPAHPAIMGMFDGAASFQVRHSRTPAGVRQGLDILGRRNWLAPPGFRRHERGHRRRSERIYFYAGGSEDWGVVPHA